MKSNGNATQKKTLSEHAYTQIKSMIFHREFLPGSPLVLQTLAEKLGMSRMPVVEAIRRLERDGLVDVVPQWGAYVKQWTRDEMLEAYCIRRALEGEAARYFVQRATAADKERLVLLSERFDASVAEDVAKSHECDIELHLHIARSTGFGRLYELIETSGIETSVINGLTLATFRDVEHARQGCHKTMVEALLGEDPEQAVRSVWQHIDTNLESIMKLKDNAQRDFVATSNERVSDAKRR